MRYSGGQLQQLWIGSGGSPGQSQIMAAIGLAESGGNPSAINPGVGARGRRTAEYSVGLWQINTLVHKKFSVAQLKDPQINAREAVRIHKLQGLRAWGAYTDKRYLKFMRTAGQNPGQTPPEQPDRPGDPNLSTFGQISYGVIAIGVLAVLVLLDD